LAFSHNSATIPANPPRFSPVVVHYPRTINMDYPRFPETFRKSFAVVFGNLCAACRWSRHKGEVYAPFPISYIYSKFGVASLASFVSVLYCCDEAHNIIYSITIDRSRFNVMVVYNRKALHAIQKYQTNATVSQNSMTIFIQTKNSQTVLSWRRTILNNRYRSLKPERMVVCCATLTFTVTAISAIMVKAII